MSLRGEHDEPSGAEARLRPFVVAVFATVCGYAAFRANAFSMARVPETERSGLLTVAYIAALAGAFVGALVVNQALRWLSGCRSRVPLRVGSVAFSLPLLFALWFANRDSGPLLAVGILFLAGVVWLLVTNGLAAAPPAASGSRGMHEVFIPPALGAALGTYLLCILAPGPNVRPRVVLLGCILGVSLAFGLLRLRFGAWRPYARSLCGVALLPLAGVLRNPGLAPAVAVLVIACCLHAMHLAVRSHKVAGATRLYCDRVLRLVDRALPTLALFGAVAILFVPFALRELPQVNFKGHEGHHLGWLNSMSHGAFPFADCGFIYGPGREIALYGLTKAMGGLTLEHVRLAHVIVTVLGFLSLAWCVHSVSRNSVIFLSVSWLLLFHTALVSFVIYDFTYSFGWSDALRAGLPCAALVYAFDPKRTHATFARRRRLFLAGVLVGLSTLYSHDFGLLAIAAGMLGAFLDGWMIDGLQRTRLRAGIAMTIAFVVGTTLVLSIFVLTYVAYGRGHRLLEAFRWVLVLAQGKADFARVAYPVNGGDFLHLSSLTARVQAETQLGSSRFDFVLGPLIPFLAAPLIAVRFLRSIRSPAVAAGLPRLVAVTALAALSFRHPFMTSDGWHLANATAPAIVLLAVLLSEMPSFDREAASSSLKGLGAPAAVLASFGWTMLGATHPLEHRLLRIHTAEERPSRGPAYVYKDLPRAGDVFVPVSTQNDARALIRAVGPNGSFFSTTWMLGGGLEAFLVARPNPTGIDVPHEVVTEAQKSALLRRMKEDPPTIIYGDYFEYYGPDVRRLIETRWTVIPGGTIATLRRYRAP